MKYKVGDKIKIIRATGGCYGAEGKIGIITNKPSINGLCDNKDGFNVDCGHGDVWRIGYESECELLDELTAEEAIRIHGKLCLSTSCIRCPIGNLNNDRDCPISDAENSEKVVEILKQWKKDHETRQNKKEQKTEIIETENVTLINVMKEEGDDETCIYVYEIDVSKEIIDEKMKELVKQVKQYYKENGDKIYAKCEHICRVKS